MTENGKHLQDIRGQCSLVDEWIFRNDRASTLDYCAKVHVTVSTTIWVIFLTSYVLN